jgi:hypothetical protein
VQSTSESDTKDGGIRNTLKVVRLKKKSTVYSDIPTHPKLRDLLKTYYDKQSKIGWVGDGSSLPMNQKMAI